LFDLKMCVVMSKERYECENCGKIIDMDNGKIPNCCGKPMKQLPLDVCLQPSHAEHARPMDSDEPCDDGRSG
jgi:hypothetical protein